MKITTAAQLDAVVDAVMYDEPIMQIARNIVEHTGDETLVDALWLLSLNVIETTMNALAVSGLEPVTHDEGMAIVQAEFDSQFADFLKDLGL